MYQHSLMREVCDTYKTRIKSIKVGIHQFASDPADTRKQQRNIFSKCSRELIANIISSVFTASVFKVQDVFALPFSSFFELRLRERIFKRFTFKH